MAMKVPLLDEQEFIDPRILHDLPGQHIDQANNFAWYFANSQFYDASSLNQAVFSSHQADPAKFETLHNRRDFERAVQNIKHGLQFMVAGEPQGEGQPWLLQRQHKVPNAEDEVETHVEGNYYNQGFYIRQAPSVLDVVRARMLAISTRLQQVAELSQNMTHWTPATGYSYYPPSYDSSKPTETASRIGSPTLAPMDLDQPEGTTTAAQPSEPAESTTEFSDALFMQSLMLTNRYGDEYMDENPLKGEPGAFVFTNTKNAVGERNKAQAQAASQPAAAAAAAAAVTSRVDTRPPSVAPSVAATPRGAPTPVPEAHSRKGSTANVPKDKKRERRKSKGLASPTTPGVPPTG
ncbi:mediator of RNA polymerase II transcription subunit 6 [Parastagonospora nodorum]|nr:mediator of RNA polymerase II transcription subunit 6 [Parastagonospora nodorum]KAH4040902.1 mediator of RNA polymerase II transcription subunit 6 [Parastagonospora nodorum]KAH4069199.1 mediator of RNA polymerase II transcription subunit 6 [Parastagonospora nodorum]KAH4088269.1 mediator of RNA polymerase II transcription subunit 6 [Parastagonospora nodorum]KAH4132819.1 mediator of RNA polymerase II transcription subunit 6 [Parastagonospora nodorum]